MPSAVMAVPKPVSPLTTPPATAPARRMAICPKPMTATFANRQEELRFGKVAVGIARSQRRQVRKGGRLIPARHGPDQDADADGDRQRDQRAALGLIGELAERIAAHLGAALDRFVAETRPLVDRHALAASKRIADLAEDRPDRLDDLVARGRSARRAPAGAFAEHAQFLLDGAQVTGNGGDARIELRCTMLKHQFSPVVGLLFSGAWMSGISGGLRCGSVIGSGGGISGSCRLGSSMSRRSVAGVGCPNNPATP